MGKGGRRGFRGGKARVLRDRKEDFWSDGGVVCGFVGGILGRGWELQECPYNGKEVGS